MFSSLPGSSAAEQAQIDCAYHSVKRPACSCVLDHVAWFIVNADHSIM
jgi:hypothetical protein